MLKQIYDSFDKDNIGLCIKDTNSIVLHQNKHSKTLCGPQVHAYCDRCNDVSLSTKALKTKQKILHNFLCTLSIIHLGDTRITLLQRISDIALDCLFDQLKATSFTECERRIVSFLLEGIDNATIQQKLVITKSTLKTHLNHIYQKIPEFRGFRETYLHTTE